MSTKTDKILEIVLTIVHEPRQMISEEKLKEMIVSDKSDKTFYRWKKKLTEEELFEGSAPLKCIKHGETTYYALNNELFKNFIPEHLETAYFLESYKKLGYLFRNFKYDQDIKELKESHSINGKGEEMRRKFFYLSKLKSNEPNKIQENSQAIIVASLINNHVIALQYNDKFYPKVFPLCLCQYRDALYLIAYKEEIKETMIRRFKLNRIQNVIETKEVFKYPQASEWTPEIYFENSSGIITGENKDAIIRISGLSKDLIIERDFFHGKLLNQTISYDEYKLTYSALDEFLGQLFVYAQDIEVISPLELKEAFIQKARYALDKNLPPNKKKAA